jgi:hypothetical protein
MQNAYEVMEELVASATNSMRGPKGDECPFGQDFCQHWALPPTERCARCPLFESHEEERP